MNTLLTRFPVAFVLLFLVPVLAMAWSQDGTASWYGGSFHGKLTANGETFDTHSFTAAHRSLPFGTMVEVVNLTNNRVVHVRINDRGPFVDDRIIDLSYAAALDLDMVGDGTAPVRLMVEPGSFPPVEFTVQIGAWSQMENARKHHERLIRAGLDVTARLGSKGITRLSMDKVPEEKVHSVVNTLGELGYEGLFVYQNIHSAGNGD